MKELSMKGKHIYVVIMCDKPRFITKIDYASRTAEWEATGIPYEFQSWDDANYVCLGLMWSGQYAFPVVSSVEQTTPFYSKAKEA